MNREKQISEMTKIISEMYSVYDTTAEDIAQGLFEKGYRKMDEVTLRLDLGDRSVEEIQQIAEAFNKAMATEQTLGVAKMDDGLRLSLEAEKDKEQIVKKTLENVLGFLWGWNNGSLDRVIDAFVQKYGVEVGE